MNEEQKRDIAVLIETIVYREVLGVVQDNGYSLPCKVRVNLAKEAGKKASERISKAYDLNKKI